MDVIACSVSRSGNYQPQLDYVQAIFPDRECFVWSGHDSAFYFPIGKQSRLSLPNRPPFVPNVARFSEPRQFMAQFARRIPELRHRLFFAENSGINLRKNCGE